MKRVLGKDLKTLFIDVFNQNEIIQYEDGNPFLLFYAKKYYFIFLKNISPAYYPKYPDITRIQLPFSQHFKKISKSNIPFIILGYDSEYDTFTAWDPQLAKSRLNVRSNVSLFSRASFQKKLRKNQFSKNNISNGDKVIVFNRRTVTNFLNNHEQLFENNISNLKLRKIKINTSIKKGKKSFKGKLNYLNDLSALEKVEKYLKANNFIEAVLFCFEFYNEKYPNMTLIDWKKMITKMIQKKVLLLR